VGKLVRKPEVSLQLRLFHQLFKLKTPGIYNKMPLKNNKKEGVMKSIEKHIVKPIIPHFTLKDMMQIIIGASILAVPVGFTEETWNLGGTLPTLNVLGLMALSLLFISLFTYYEYHKHATERRQKEYVKRVIATYLLSFLIVAIILGLIQRTPWNTDWLLAFKRIVIVAFPSSLSGVIADTIK
jgi:uncharacterized membrane protein